MTQNRSTSGTGGGLQPVPGKTHAGDVQKKAGGEFVDMQELMPVMSSFQEHLAAEQRKHQSRMRSMIFLFVVLFGVFLIVPVYMGKVFLAQSRANLDAQSAAQDKLAKSLSTAMTSLADASRGLRDELALQRAARIERPVPAPVVETPVKPSEPPPKNSENEKQVAEVKIDTTPVKNDTIPPAPVMPPPPVEQVKPVAVAVEEIKQPVVEISPAAHAAAKENLKTLLKQVEDAIAQKEREMKAHAK